jgi:hypothetical protein
MNERVAYPQNSPTLKTFLFGDDADRKPAQDREPSPEYERKVLEPSHLVGAQTAPLRVRAAFEGSVERS